MASFKDLKASRTAQKATRVAQSAQGLSEGTDEQLEEPEAGSSTPQIAARCSSVQPPIQEQSNDTSTTSTRDSETYAVPQGIEVRRSLARGRGLYTTKQFKAGSRLLRTQPRVGVLSTQHLRTYCSSCHLSPSELFILTGQQRPSLKRCVGCRMLYYCSQRCQVIDWTHHREECAAHKKIRGMFATRYPTINPEESPRWIMSQSTRALGRLCWARSNARKVGGDTSWWKEIAEMESHVKRLSEEAIMGLAKQVQQLRYYLSATGPEMNSKEPSPVDMEEYGFGSSAQLLDIVSSLQVNSFTLSSPSLSPIGVAMSPLVALCNHSCDPNAVVVFPNGAGQGMEIIAIREIAQGEEILTSYIDVSLPKKERHEDLKRRYDFECDCQLCVQADDQSWVDPRWCIKHPNCQGGKGKGTARMTDLDGISRHETRCNVCGQGFTVDMTRLRGSLTQGKDLLKQDEAGKLDPEQAKTILSTLVPALLQHFPPSSYPLLALLRLRSLLLISPTSPAEHNTAIASLALAYAGAEKVYPPSHPTLAIILSEWGKLLAMNDTDQEKEDTVKGDRSKIAQRLTEAIVVLRKAVEGCDKGFGVGGGIVGKEMEGLLVGCQGELGLIRTSR